MADGKRGAFLPANLEKKADMVPQSWGLVKTDKK